MNKGFIINNIYGNRASNLQSSRQCNIWNVNHLNLLLFKSLLNNSKQHRNTGKINSTNSYFYRWCSGWVSCDLALFKRKSKQMLISFHSSHLLILLNFALTSRVEMLFLWVWRLATKFCYQNMEEQKWLWKKRYQWSFEQLSWVSCWLKKSIPGMILWVENLLSLACCYYQTTQYLETRKRSVLNRILILVLVFLQEK